MRSIVTIILCIFLRQGALLGSDPIVITMAEDSTVACGATDIEIALTQWYESAGGAEAEDDQGGPIIFDGTPSLEEALMQFESSSTDMCGNTMSVTVSFVAVDEEGDEASLGEATFATIDNTPPTITAIPSFITYDCQDGLQDTLIEWVQTKGGATASDECSDVAWTNFIWNDSEGNSGVGSIAEGPYPQLLGVCEYNFNMSFLVVDDCGNQRATTGSFSVEDSSGPVFTGVPASGEYSCDNIPTVDQVEVSDFCDPDVNFEFSEDSTQGSDPEDCTFYNYIITRTWTSEDGCGNSTAENITLEISDQSPPVVSGLDTVNLSCTSFLNNDTIYIAAVDDCSGVTVSYTDTDFTQSCSFAFDRSYIVTDVCGNASSFTQRIEVEDTNPPSFDVLPSDNVVSCSMATDLDATFQTWVADIVSSNVNDGCSNANIFAAVPESYDLNDQSTYPGVSVGSFDAAVCPSLLPSFLRSETVDFVVYDDCGNAATYSATFGVGDEVSPVIDNCPSDISMVLPLGACAMDITIPTITASDDCGDMLTANISLNTGQTQSIILDQENTVPNVSQGTYTAQVIVTDCAGNDSTCDFIINVLDEELPIIETCGTDSIIVLDNGNCEVEFALFDEVLASDNCSFEKAYEEKLPLQPSNELLTFSIVADDTLVNNETYTFEGLFPVLFTTKPILLTASLTAATEEASAYFTVFGEGGAVIGETVTGSNCTTSETEFLIPPATFNEWVTDGALDISFIANTAGGSISPCSELNTDNTDGNSKLSVTLTYSAAEIQYQISGATNTSKLILENGTNTNLNVGTNTITYSVLDMSGNEGSCTFEVVVQENVAPTANCRNTIINISPDGETAYILDPALVDDGSNDLCSDVTITVSPSVFTCDQVGTDVEVTLVATDVSGNEDSCTALVKVEPYDLMPTFSAGVCQDDTLKLFANAPASATPGIYTYSWSGPNTFVSDIADPTILNATAANNGTYFVTVTGFNGCSTTGSVLVNVEALSTPTITLSNDTTCVGEPLILNSTAFTGSITYQWYEGAFPSGTLLEETLAPTLILDPSPGQHLYYVIAKSDNCESNPSPVVSVLSIEVPVAMVNDNFINICEEDNITLGTTSFGAGYTYDWTGPDGFTSNDPLPEIIKNVTLANAGDYNLVISASGCVSDTATTKVNIFEKPNTPIITSGETFCEGSTLSLTVNNIASAELYTWYLNGMLYTTDTDNSLVIPNAQASVSGSWQVTVRDGICTSDTSEIQNIVIDDLEEISIANDGPVCAGDSVQLFVTFIAGATYQWSGPGGFTSDLQNPKALAMNGNYTVDITTGTNCETSATTTVEVNTAPTITALSNNSEACMDGETNIVFFPTVVPVNGNFMYVWSGPNGFTSEEVNPILINPTAEVNGTYSLVVVNENCTSEPAISVVDIAIIPDQPTIDIPAIICEGADVTITSSVSGTGFVYIWKTPNGNITTLVPSLELLAVTNAEEGEYSLLIQNGICESIESEVVNLEVTSQPDSPAFITNSAVCEGESLLLNITDIVAGAEYQWQGPSGIIGMGTTLEIENISTEDAGNYSVKIILDGCESNFGLGQEVEVLASLSTPQAEADEYDLCIGISNSLEICIDEATAEPGATYVLVNDNTNVIITTSNSICFIIDDISVFEQGTNFLHIQADKDGCTSAESPQFRVELSNVPSVQASILENDQSACIGESVALNAQNGPPLVDVKWLSEGNSLTYTTDDSQTTSVSGFEAGENKVILSYSQNACVDYTRDTIVVTLQDDPLTADDSYTTLFGEPVVMDLLANDNVPIDYTIEIINPPSSGEVVGEDNPLTFNPDNRISGVVTFVYEVCALDCPDQCDEAVVSIAVGEDSDCIAPTIITPNDDGINDAFVVPCLNNNAFPDSELTIFNEWGDEVFSAENYDNSWEGTFQGKDLPVGTYFYILEIGDGRESLRNFLMIQR